MITKSTCFKTLALTLSILGLLLWQRQLLSQVVEQGQSDGLAHTSLPESFSLDQRTLLSPPMPPVREDEKFIDLDEVMDFASMETRLFDTPISCNASCGHTETRQSVAGAKELLMQLKKMSPPPVQIENCENCFLNSRCFTSKDLFHPEKCAKRTFKLSKEIVGHCFAKHPPIVIIGDSRARQLYSAVIDKLPPDRFEIMHESPYRMESIFSRALFLMVEKSTNRIVVVYMVMTIIIDRTYDELKAMFDFLEDNPLVIINSGAHFMPFKKSGDAREFVSRLSDFMTNLRDILPIDLPIFVMEEPWYGKKRVNNYDMEIGQFATSMHCIGTWQSQDWLRKATRKLVSLHHNFHMFDSYMEADLKYIKVCRCYHPYVDEPYLSIESYRYNKFWMCKGGFHPGGIIIDHMANLVLNHMCL